jgi:AmiR/NasT family two-component response regulator
VRGSDGKGILQRELGLSEHGAFLVLQRQSRQKRRPMKEIAQAIILSTEVKAERRPKLNSQTE